jgi:hypothetical protein
MMRTILKMETGYIYSANAGFAELFISASTDYTQRIGLLPNYLCTSLNRVRDTNPPNTKRGNDFVLPIFLKASSQNCLLYNGMKIYNTMKRSAEFTVVRNISHFRELNIIPTIVERLLIII